MRESHTITETVFVPAEEGVRIDGWESTCSCGFTTGSSLGERWANKQGWEHVRYMNNKEGN